GQLNLSARLMQAIRCLATDDGGEVIQDGNAPPPSPLSVAGPHYGVLDQVCRVRIPASRAVALKPQARKVLKPRKVRIGKRTKRFQNLIVVVIFGPQSHPLGHGGTPCTKTP